MIFYILLCLLLITLDQLSKYCAVIFLKPYSSIPILPNIFELAYVENRGMAFGMFEGGRWIFISFTTLIIIAIIVYLIRLSKTKKYNGVKLALVLIESGAIGNLIDRVRSGFVVDFLYAKFINFPVFNLADSYVVIGTILLAILVLFFVRDDLPALR